MTGPITGDALRAAFAELPLVEGDINARGTPIAERLCEVIESARAQSAINAISQWAFNIEFALTDGGNWKIECLSPEAFRMYPAGANVWVRETDMGIDELVEVINDIAFRSEKEAENA